MFHVLLRFYPPSYRERYRDDFTAACLACVERERRRLGRAGALYAWTRLTADSIAAGTAMRLEERRTRRIMRLRDSGRASQENPMARLVQDLVYGTRIVRRAPVISAVVVLTLAVAIAATTSVFGVLDAVLLRPLPYRDAERLVIVYQGIPKAFPTPIGFSPPDYLAMRDRVQAFDSIAVFRNREYELSGVDTPERIIVARASASLFGVIGVAPALGTTYSREDDEGARPVAVISDGLWRRKFSQDPAVIGRAVVLDRRPYTIVGVMPRGFLFPRRGPLLNDTPADVYLPISFTPFERGAFGSMYNNSVIARLKPGVSATQADAEVRSLVRSNALELYPAELAGLASAIGASATPFRDEITGRTRTLVLVTFGAVGFVLLIACVDIAGLMLTRAFARRREIAVRVALGAGRGRIIRQLLVESALLAVAGGALGLMLTWWLSRTLGRIAPPTLVGLAEITIDGRVLAFSAGISLLTALLCGLIPAIEISRPGGGGALKEGGRTDTPGVRQRRLFVVLVTTQVAIAVVLLVGGGLLFRSLSRLMSVDPGFRGDRVLTMATSLPAAGYRSGADVRAFYTRLIDELQRIPGISAAGASTELPLSVRERRAFAVENEPEANRGLQHSGAQEWILGSYFEAMGIPLKRGRFLSTQDREGTEPVAVVNETMARRFWGDADPVGQRIAWGGPSQHGPWMRIVGVIGDVKQGPLNTETVPHIYTAWLQAPDQMLGENVVGMMRSMRLAMRSEIDPASMMSTARQHIRAIDPALPITAVQTMEEVVRTSTGSERFNAMLIGSFALLALLLSTLGIAGVLATSVSGRTRELGVRLALGAQPRSLVRMVVREGMTLAAFGLMVGLPVAWALSRVLSTLLFEVSPRDPLTFVAVAAVLATGSLLACWIPAWRAARINPLTALRQE